MKLTLDIQDLPEGESLEDLAAKDGGEPPRERVDTPNGPVLLRRDDGEESGARLYAAVPGTAAVASVTADALSDDQLVRAARLVAAAIARPTPMLARTYSTEELTLLAEIAGSASFPGTGEHVLTDDRERAACRRGLMARGTISPEPADGRTCVDAVDAQLIVTSLHGDAAITVVHKGANGRSQMHVYVADDLSVTHRAEENGVHRLEGIPTPLVGAAVGRFAGLVQRPVPDAEPLTLTREEFESAKASPAKNGDPMSSLLTDLVGSCQVRVAPKADSPLKDVEVTWLDCGDRGNWLVTTDSENVTARPVGLDELAGVFEGASP